MDCTAKLWDVEMGKVHSTLKGHEGELVSLHFNADGDMILTGSFDKTAIIWDARIG
jgi:dynein assembly factor with WDR repeat domains 1